MGNIIVKCGACGSTSIALRSGSDGDYLFCKDCLEQKRIWHIHGFEVKLLEDAKRKEGPGGNLEVLLKHMDKGN